MDDIKPLSVAGYFVTRDGRILSQRRRGGSAFVGGDYHAVSAFLYRGRKRVKLYTGGGVKSAWVDELVAEAFHHGRVPFRPFHLDGDPLNCCADNLACRDAVLIKADNPPPPVPVDAEGYTPPRSWRERSNAMADRKAEVLAAIASSATKDEATPPLQPPPTPPPPPKDAAKPMTPPPPLVPTKLNSAERVAEMEARKRQLSAMIAKIGG